MGAKFVLPVREELHLVHNDAVDEAAEARQAEWDAWYEEMLEADAIFDWDAHWYDRDDDHDYGDPYDD